MANTPHELHEEFPNRGDRIRELKSNNTHFAKLFDEYHEINRKVHAAETDLKPTSDEHLSDLRKMRLSLKDQLFAMMIAD